MYRIVQTASICLCLSSPVIAEDPGSVEELVAFFSASVDLGQEKALCIGTQQECAKQAEPEGRDMLVTFELGSADLTPSAQASLDVFVQAINDDRLRPLNFAVEGHTDGRGTELFNDTLSYARAESVKAFLIAKGVDPARLTALGLGERQPRTENVYDPQNRRVELRVNPL